MGRYPDYDRLTQLVAHIRCRPGQRAAYYARLMNLDNKAVIRMLEILENHRVLLTEDTNGRLHYIRGAELLPAYASMRKGPQMTERAGTLSHPHSTNES